MLRVKGAEGEIKCGYQVAARLKNWELEHQVLEAEPESVNTLWLSLSPLNLHLKVGKRTWRWHNVELLENGHRIRVRVKGSPNR